MNLRANILFVHLTQYGRHTNSYKHCKNLMKHYDMTYLCFEENVKKIEDDVNVIYLQKEGSSVRNVFKIIREARKLIKQNDYQLIYIFYFKFCFLIKLFLEKNFLLDIRTGAIAGHRAERWRSNFLLRIESFFFDNITILSNSLRKKLKLNSFKCTVVPLGSDILSSKNKSYDKLSLFYIGSLNNREIYKTVHGLAKFLRANRDKNIEITYDIFGYANKEKTLLLTNSIIENGLNNIVKYHGRKEHYEIQDYFDNCNVGVSYIPMTEYYDCQPSTKTFEYINSGMVCLATDTSANRDVINDKNGILFDDNADAFKDALDKLYRNRNNYKTDEILQTLEMYTWKRIFEDKLFPLIKNIIKKDKRILK